MRSFSSYLLAGCVGVSLALACSGQESYDRGRLHGAQDVCVQVRNDLVSLQFPLNPGSGDPSTLPEPAQSQFLKLQELEARVKALCDPFLQAGN